jgi:hypothetical protein
VSKRFIFIQHDCTKFCVSARDRVTLLYKEKEC